MTTQLLNMAVTQIAGQISELAGKVALLEKNQRSGYNAPNTSVAGSITITDQIGTPAVVIGEQSDGTFTAKQIATIVPPKAPDTPLVAPGINGLYVSWDGLMNDGSTPAADFAAVQIHVSTVSNFTPSSATLQGHIVGAGLFGVGGLTPGTTYYVQLLAINGVGDSGLPSAQASGVPVAVPAGVIPNGSITALQIQTGTITAAQIAAAAGILGSQIQTGTITSANILAGTITAALLAAGLVVAGIVDATTITGSILRNSTTDPKTSINADGSISITVAGGTVIFKIGPDGTISWFSPGGTLLMQLQPGGNQLIYASLTGPAGWNFEPPGPPALLFSLSSATSSTTYANAPTVPVAQGSTITVVGSASGATNVTGVTDSQNNTYVQVQSVTSGVNMQVFQATGVNPLSTHDSITVTYGAANTQEKNFIALATSGVVTTSVTDFSAQANGTSTSPSVSGTPNFYGDALLFFVSNASAGGIPSAITDGWVQLAQQQIAGNQNTSVYYSANVNGSAQTATATIVSAAWSAIMIGLKMSPLTPIANGIPTGVLATLSPSTVWTGDGQFSLKITHSGTTTGWGASFPAFPVQPGTTCSMQCQIMTPAALSAVSIGFTFYSGAGGTGTNLGSVSGDQGTLATSANGIYVLSITGATVPAGATSAVFFISEGAADASGTAFYIDTIQVPGGLVYSNSPTGGTDSLGNSFEQGINFIGLPGLTNVFGVEDPYGNQLMAIDAKGNVQGQTLSAAVDVLVAGQSINAALAGNFPAGLVNYGFKAIGSTAWPPTAIGTTEVALFELDQVCQPGRLYEFCMNQTIINSLAAGSMHLHLRYTTDGSTPTTSSTEAALVASRLETGSTDSAIGPIRALFGPFASTTTLRCLVSGHAGASTFQFKNDDFVRCMIYDLGTANITNNLTVIGSGSSGSGSKQQFTKTYFATSSFSYYGSQKGSTQRSSNSSMYQGCASGQLGSTGDQYSFAMFNYGQIATDLGAGTVTQVQLRLTNIHSWYNSGMTVIAGYTTYTGVFGSTFIPGAGTHEDEETWHINEGQTLTRTLGAWAVSAITSGFTGFIFGPSASFSSATDLNDYGYFFGFSSTNHSSCPALIMTYTK